MWNTDNEACWILGVDYNVDEAVVKNIAWLYVESGVSCISSKSRPCFSSWFKPNGRHFLGRLESGSESIGRS